MEAWAEAAWVTVQTGWTTRVEMGGGHVGGQGEVTRSGRG